MANPFYSPPNGQFSANNQRLGDVVSSFQSLLKLGNNPEQIQNVLFSKYPNLKQTYEQISKSGMSPIDYAISKAMERNIDVNPAIQQMMNMINNRY